METLQKTSLTPKFFFISLGVLVSLITSVTSFLILFFETLNKKFPDVLNATYQYGYNSYDYDSIRMTLATLIIFFPVFLVLSYFWRKLYKLELGKIDEIIFKWMIYLIIFITGLVIVIDLVTLVRYFVSGEITNRFVFKVLGTGIIAGLVGFNYFFELKNHKTKNYKNILSILFSIVSILIFLGLIIWSFVIMGSPKDQRIWRLDNKRIDDLQNIQNQIINYWQQKEKLPLSLLELSNPMNGYLLPMDPEFESGLVYEYTPKDKLSFELCATFKADIPKGWREGSYNNGNLYELKSDVMVPSYPYPDGINNSWGHGIGRTCFNRTIDKDIYPPFEKIK